MKRDIVAFALIQFKDQLNLKNFNYSRSETEKDPPNKSKRERCKYEWKLHNPPHSRTIFFSKLLKIDIAAKNYISRNETETIKSIWYIKHASLYKTL